MVDKRELNERLERCVEDIEQFRLEIIAILEVLIEKPMVVSQIILAFVTEVLQIKSGQEEKRFLAVYLLLKACETKPQQLIDELVDSENKPLRSLFEALSKLDQNYPIEKRGEYYFSNMGGMKLRNLASNFLRLSFELICLWNQESKDPYFKQLERNIFGPNGTPFVKTYFWGYKFPENADIFTHYSKFSNNQKSSYAEGIKRSNSLLIKQDSRGQSPDAFNFAQGINDNMQGSSQYRQQRTHFGDEIPPERKDVTPEQRMTEFGRQASKKASSKVNDKPFKFADQDDDDENIGESSGKVSRKEAKNLRINIDGDQNGKNVFGLGGQSSDKFERGGDRRPTGGFSTTKHEDEQNTPFDFNPRHIQGGNYEGTPDPRLMTEGSLNEPFTSARFNHGINGGSQTDRIELREARAKTSFYPELEKIKESLHNSKQVRTTVRINHKSHTSYGSGNMVDLYNKYIEENEQQLASSLPSKNGRVTLLKSPKGRLEGTVKFPETESKSNIWGLGSNSSIQPAEYVVSPKKQESSSTAEAQNAQLKKQLEAYEQKIKHLENENNYWQARYRQKEAEVYQLQRQIPGFKMPKQSQQHRQTYAPKSNKPAFSYSQTIEEQQSPTFASNQDIESKANSKKVSKFSTFGDAADPYNRQTSLDKNTNSGENSYSFALGQQRSDVSSPKISKGFTFQGEESEKTAGSKKVRYEEEISGPGNQHRYY